MTAGIRRWTRCGESNNISDRVAAIWRHRSENLGTIANDLLGENRFREMVAVAVLLILRPGVTFKMTEGETDQRKDKAALKNPPKPKLT
jgi:hypothetical protein